ncbi:MAG TPA: hypothetical protein VMS98_01845 [Thermoanaerobaculia bacterium]|nr:hypothetical protein [Thermoanaerobaculia bacterium]
MPVLLTLLLATAFPSASKTSWMTPQSFRLTIGMARGAAVQTLMESGWTLKPGRNEDEVVIDYSAEKALTLEFSRERLRSVRFELFALLPEVQAAFFEQKTYLQKAHGEPKRNVRSKSIVLYDDRLPNIMVVVSADPKTEYGRKGFGYLAVRYYDPVNPVLRP